ncbi:hypothetical protein DFH06DRAFT_1123492 [Mycena polygramma]|nr:hypothetical protein DFH06DRAFT_1123492 [Mycena polygramma]
MGGREVPGQSFLEVKVELLESNFISFKSLKFQALKVSLSASGARDDVKTPQEYISRQQEGEALKDLALKSPSIPVQARFTCQWCSNPVPAASSSLCHIEGALSRPSLSLPLGLQAPSERPQQELEGFREDNGAPRHPRQHFDPCAHFNSGAQPTAPAASTSALPKAALDRVIREYDEDEDSGTEGEDGEHCD